jgi:argininosuccinate lyase
MMLSLLSVGKSLFMGYNRDTQWTKYWIMDLADESKPSLSVMTDIIRLLQVNEGQMLKLAKEEFLGATSLMEWLVGYGHLPMRKAKMVVEKAVKYSAKERKENVSHEALKKALAEMKIHIAVREEDVIEIQKPERVLIQDLSFGMPSEKRVKEGISLFRKKVRANKNWLMGKRRGIERAKALLFKMERQLFT